MSSEDCDAKNLISKMISKLLKYSSEIHLEWITPQPLENWSPPPPEYTQGKLKAPTNLHGFRFTVKGRGNLTKTLHQLKLKLRNKKIA